MEIQSLRILALVARQGSFAAAARSIETDPSTISRMVAGLEAELGLRIFERSTRNLRLTDAGAEYLERVAPLVEGIEAAGAEIAAGQVVPAGRVRLSASVAFGQEMLVPLLTQVREALPGVTLELHLGDDPVDLVGAGMDMAIRLGPQPTGDLIATRLRPTAYRVVASPGYLARAGHPGQPEALATRDCLRMTLADFRSEWRFRRNGTERSVLVDGPVLISNVLALRAACRAGHGPALLADWLVGEDLRSGRLVDLFPNEEVSATTFETAAWLLYPSRAHLPVRTRAVIELLKKAL